jgi:hypothetical protein
LSVVVQTGALQEDSCVLVGGGRGGIEESMEPIAGLENDCRSRRLVGCLLLWSSQRESTEIRHPRV